MDSLTLTSISTGFTSLFFFVAGLAVFFRWRKQKENILLKFFVIFLIAFAIQQFFFALGTGPASLNPKTSNWLWAVAHIFMFIAISYFLRFSVHLRFPHLEKYIFYATIGYSIIGIVILFYSAPQIEPFFLENGVYNWKVTPLAGAVIGIFTTLCLLSSFAIFIDEGRKVKEKILKLRSFLIAGGILLFLTGGPLHNFVKTPLLTILADFSIVIGALLMVLGVYSRKILKSSTIS